MKRPVKSLRKIGVIGNPVYGKAILHRAFEDLKPRKIEFPNGSVIAMGTDSAKAGQGTTNFFNEWSKAINYGLMKGLDEQITNPYPDIFANGITDEALEEACSVAKGECLQFILERADKLTKWTDNIAVIRPYYRQFFFVEEKPNKAWESWEKPPREYIVGIDNY